MLLTSGLSAIPRTSDASVLDISGITTKNLKLVFCYHVVDQDRPFFKSNLKPFVFFTLPSLSWMSYLYRWNSCLTFMSFLSWSFCLKKAPINKNVHYFPFQNNFFFLKDARLHTIHHRKENNFRRGRCPITQQKSVDNVVHHLIYCIVMYVMTICNIAIMYWVSSWQNSWNPAWLSSLTEKTLGKMIRAIGDWQLYGINEGTRSD